MNRAMNVWAMLCVIGVATAVYGQRPTSTTDTRPTGLLGDLLEDLIDKDTDTDTDTDRPAPKEDPHEYRGHDHDDVPHHNLNEADRHRIRFIEAGKDRVWEHGDREHFWHWDEATARGKVRFELWRGSKRIAELKPPVENDGKARLSDPVFEGWGSGRNFYIVAVDNQNRIGVSHPFTIFGGVLVTYPTDATIWQTDDKGAKINWDRSTAKGERVKVELYKGDKYIAQLKDRVPNDGEATLDGAVREAWGAGDDYRVRVVDGKGRGGFSETFRINSGPMVNYPNKLTRWRYPASDAHVRWDKSSARGGKVDVELWKGDDRIAQLKKGVPNDGEAKLDGVDPKWGTGEGYTIRVVDEGGRGRAGSSEPFVISAEIEVTKPGRGVTWMLGEKRVQVKWRAATASGKVRFELWTADKKKKLADFLGEEKNDGEAHRNEGFDFDVEPGEYRLRAIDVSGFVGWSDPFRVRAKK